MADGLVAGWGVGGAAVCHKHRGRPWLHTLSPFTPAASPSHPSHSRPRPLTLHTRGLALPPCRYSDVLPYDHNRVLLGHPPAAAAAAAAAADDAAFSSPSRNTRSCSARRATSLSADVAASAAAAPAAGADYINASLLESGVGGGERWAYIAAQGPLKHTRDAFWQMACEQRCPAVVMLTNTGKRRGVSARCAVGQRRAVRGLIAACGPASPVAALLGRALTAPAPSLHLPSVQWSAASASARPTSLKLRAQPRRWAALLCRCVAWAGWVQVAMLCGCRGSSACRWLHLCSHPHPSCRAAHPSPPIPHPPPATLQTAALEELEPDLHRRSLVLKDSGAPRSASLDAPSATAAAGAAAAAAAGGASQQPQQPLKRQHSGGLDDAAGAGAAERPRYHQLSHYHYTAWPDHGVPRSPEPLLRLCAELREQAGDGPVLVHCSGAHARGLWTGALGGRGAVAAGLGLLHRAHQPPCPAPRPPVPTAGIGRSGVFCVLDVVSRRLLRLVGSTDSSAGAAAVDVARLVADLRCAVLGRASRRLPS